MGGLRPRKMRNLTLKFIIATPIDSCGANPGVVDWA
jgi:hypothetical protein